MNMHESGVATTVPPVWEPTPEQIENANLTLSRWLKLWELPDRGR
jgi:hypothetical protein